MRRPQRPGLDGSRASGRSRPRAGACRSRAPPATAAAARAAPAGSSGSASRWRGGSGKRCRFLKGKKGFTRPQRCSKRVYVTAKGTTRWRYTFRGRLAKGRYRAYVRSTDATGNGPRTLPKAAIKSFRVR